MRKRDSASNIYTIERRLQADENWLELARWYARQGRVREALVYARLGGPLVFEQSGAEGTWRVLEGSLHEYLDFAPTLVEPVVLPLQWGARRVRLFACDCAQRALRLAAPELESLDALVEAVRRLACSDGLDAISLEASLSKLRHRAGELVSDAYLARYTHVDSTQLSLTPVSEGHHRLEARYCAALSVSTLTETDMLSSAVWHCTKDAREAAAFVAGNAAFEEAAGLPRDVRVRFQDEAFDSAFLHEVTWQTERALAYMTAPLLPLEK